MIQIIYRWLRLILTEIIIECIFFCQWTINITCFLLVNRWMHSIEMTKVRLYLVAQLLGNLILLDHLRTRTNTKQEIFRFERKPSFSEAVNFSIPKCKSLHSCICTFRMCTCAANQKYNCNFLKLRCRLMCVCVCVFSLMISAALNPPAVADSHLASFVITQMWGSVLHGQLTQSFHWIFLNPPLKLADPMLAHLDTRWDLYSPRRLWYISCRLLLSARDKTASSNMTTFGTAITI